MKRVAPAALLFLVVGCYIAVHDDDRPRRTSTIATAGATWQATMRVGERALFDGGALELTLREARPGTVTLQIRDARGQSTVELRGTGVGGGVTWPPYRVWLATAGSGTATIMVSRE
jgi:hypothetical protein